MNNNLGNISLMLDKNSTPKIFPGNNLMN